MDGAFCMSQGGKPFPRHAVLGVDIDYCSAEEACAAVLDWAQAGEGGYVCVPNAHVLIEAADDPTYAAVLAGAKLRMPDSAVLQKARSWLYDVPMRETLLGGRFTQLIAGQAAARGLRVGLIGGAPNSLKLMQENLQRDFPTLQVTHAVSPPFGPATEASAREAALAARAAGCQVIFIGLGAPKQERWMAMAAPHLPNAVMLGVGGSFDMIAGVKPSAPPIVHRLGLEWLNRLLQEPQRLGPRYLRTNPRFLMGVLRQKREMQRARSG
jgi:N-acetylglucosaminyldiphosphoundecaprenol N-acetyl-beta-D-mannosaminyltransferase